MTPISPAYSREDLVAMIHNRDELISDLKTCLDEAVCENALMRRTLETIAGNSADQLQATQARGALANIGPSCLPADRGEG